MQLYQSVEFDIQTYIKLGGLGDILLRLP